MGTFAIQSAVSYTDTAIIANFAPQRIEPGGASLATLPRLLCCAVCCALYSYYQLVESYVEGIFRENFRFAGAPSSRI